MKNLFERHRDRLAAEEREDLWATLQSRIAGKSGQLSRKKGVTLGKDRSRRGWLLSWLRPGGWPVPAGVGAVAVIAIALAITRPWESTRQPLPTEMSGPAGAESAPAAESTPETRSSAPATPNDLSSQSQRLRSRSSEQQPPDPESANQGATPVEGRAGGGSPGGTQAEGRPGAPRDEGRTGPGNPGAVLADGDTPPSLSPPGTLPPSLASGPEAGEADGSPGGKDTKSAAAGSPSRTAAVTPTETAPSPAAVQEAKNLSQDDAGNLPVDNITDLIALKAGVIARADGLHIRGGRSGDVLYQVRGEPVGDVRARDPRGGDASRWPTKSTSTAPDGTPRIPTTGGTTLPNDEVYDSMFFEHNGVNPFIPPDEDPFSTFAVDVDAASYTLMRRYIEGGHLPDQGAVRVEEFVNFFRQDYPSFDDADFRIFIDGAPSPFGSGYQLLRIGIKAREVSVANRKLANLVFVIDVSGSMEREDRLELVKRSLRMLVDELSPDDQVGIVVYGSNGRVLLEPASVGRDHRDREGHPSGWRSRDTWRSPPHHEEARDGGRERILAAIDNLHPDGSTNAEEGLLLGYEMARRMYQSGSINRVILCSDGVANVGNTGPESILERVRGEAGKGIQITTIGFGMGNYNDVLMEQLADKGDGNYYYVDDLTEANRVLVENLTGTLHTIARDAKVQVEFDSLCVARYRLLGFENRDVADRNFRNDRVDAGEIGAGHEVTALYEVKLAPGAKHGRLATVRFRYACPESNRDEAPEVREIDQGFDISRLHRSFQDASPRLRLDAAVAEFAEILRASCWAKESRPADVLPVARAAANDLPGDDAVREFVRLVERAIDLSDKLSPREQREVQGK